MSTASMSKPVAATIEVAEHEAIVKALREAHGIVIRILEEKIKELEEEVKEAIYFPLKQKRLNQPHGGKKKERTN